jgi:hypothetical protein
MHEIYTMTFSELVIYLFIYLIDDRALIGRWMTEDYSAWCHTLHLLSKCTHEVPTKYCCIFNTLGHWKLIPFTHPRTL